MHKHSNNLPQTATSPATDRGVVPQESVRQLNFNSLHRLPIQRKLTVGSVDDPLEKEADAMADRVMRMPETSFIQRKCAHCEEQEKGTHKPLASFIQRKTDTGGSVASNVITSKIQATRGAGNSLPMVTKTFMESRFGTDFSNVRIHSGSEAAALSHELNAQAFTVGNEIYFNKGKFAPETSEGKHLLAHELTHTVQQDKQHSVSTLQRQHDPGGPYHPPEGTELSCTSSDTCSQLSLKINYLRHTIRRHQEWDAANPMPQYPNGRHSQEIAELQNALATCIGHTVRCRNQPVIIPVPDPAAARRVATATAIGAGIGMVGGAIIGAIGGGTGGTLVAPGFGTIGGGAAGGVAGAAYGAGVGGVVGGAVMGGAQVLWEWLSD